MPLSVDIDDMLPPPDLHDVGPGDFKAIGQAMADGLKNHPGLQLRPHESVLDIGCGVGRLAIPLTQYLNAAGRYEGFDVVERAIAHCRDKITPRYPNFHFTCADLANSFYNPTGRAASAGYRFPYPDASFDFAFAASVFTHLLPEPSERYMLETARVLKRGGRFMATFFLIDDEARRHMEAGHGNIAFLHPHGTGCWLGVPDKPEAVLSYSEAFVRDLYLRAGFRILEPIGWGNWSGRPVKGTGYQDQIVAVKA